ncbi:hypothetical protein SCALM49S_10267 [Streptomyces californicus]
MTRPDDPAIPAVPDRPAIAPERPAGIAPVPRRGGVPPPPVGFRPAR